MSKQSGSEKYHLWLREMKGWFTDRPLLAGTSYWRKDSKRIDVVITRVNEAKAWEFTIPEARLFVCLLKNLFTVSFSQIFEMID